MENLLNEYMDRAFSDRGIEIQSGPLPVITFSREFGCPSKLIAYMLTDELNNLNGTGKPGKWRFINKEIVEATARHLELNATEVNHLFNSAGKGLVEDILDSFSHTYVSNHLIRKTITSVVRSIAGQGYVIIVGRGGAGILQNAPATIHVRLQAPLEWRIEEICKSQRLSRQESSKLVDEMDKKRTALIEMFTGGKFHPYLFDITFNCQTNSNKEIVHTLIGLMKIKNMI